MCMVSSNVLILLQLLTNCPTMLIEIDVHMYTLVVYIN